MFRKAVKQSAKLSLALAVILVLSACSWGNSEKEPRERQTNFNYKNKSLSFEVELLESFKHYVTQRDQGEGFVDIEFYVPTSDTDYSSEVRNYARPVTVRVFQDASLEELSEDSPYEVLAQANNNIYTIRFWQNIPEDWQEKWSQEDEESIKNSFSLN